MVNAKRGIFQLYHGENKLPFNDNNVHFVLHQHAMFDSNSASSLKQQSTSRHVTLISHILLILTVLAH